jgi:mRNA-degrading endonuclease YafQ of YafQ-DinJ toxin-antitoxin module
MRRIERTTAFRRDFKREKKGQHRREKWGTQARILTPPWPLGS